ncbi:MAG: endolytic transglycosylase MltG [Chitinophagaceae bacterium]|nr:endolytic transglycosylase MltG [Chitinophagaceae bacterium]MCW5927836.1 endolytic transglycosylase MltG [Chitinophagaceae bacterium]
MVKKIIAIFILAAIIIAAFLYRKVMGSNTRFEEKSYFLYIKTGSSFTDVLQTLENDEVLKDPALFSVVAKRWKLPQNIKAGKYQIDKGSSIVGIVKKLKSGNQVPVNLVINKLRTIEDLARLASKNLETDSIQIINWLSNTDSLLTLGFDSTTILSMIIPNTYSFFWNTSASRLMKRLQTEQEKFWNEERLQKSRNLSLTPLQVYTLASIVNEETNKYDEMPLMASVYINRLRQGMPLGADPTIKYATKNFAAKRVTFKMIDESASSPYNTYRNKGLPPGPICTPSVKTIDAVLNAASTNYLYFCAKADFSGYHSFAATHQEHMANARAYHKALNQLNIK